VQWLEQWKHEGREGDMPGKGRGQRSSPNVRATARRRSKLGLVVFGGVGLATVVGSDGDASLQLSGVEGDEGG
jgi:hypothetical protein